MTAQFIKLSLGIIEGGMRAVCPMTHPTAVDLTAYLCKIYDLNPLDDGVIISHYEGFRRAVASDHKDPEHYWDQLHTGYTMEGFRADVASKISNI